MIRNFLVLTLVASFALAGTVHAESGSRGGNVSSTASATTLACIAAAVNIREAALYEAITAQSDRVNAAYSLRKTALPAVYTGSYTNAQIREKVRAIWSEFRSDMKASKTKWRTASRAAWSTYRDSMKECRASSDVTDEKNSSQEATGS